MLAESGYAPDNLPKWLSRWQPQIALLSVAADDRDGLPDFVFSDDNGIA
jgi:hypothetical protein